MQFSSAGSRDPDGGALTYAWTFGDGGTSTEANPTHTYTAAGNYTAQLTVTNPKGRTAVANVPMTVGNTAPDGDHRVPAGRRLLRVGRPGQVHDQGDRPGGRRRSTATGCSLQVLLGHDEHAHPLEQHTGCTGTVQTALASGHGAEANVFAVFEATYTDDGGTGGAGAADRPRRSSSCSPSASRPSTSPAPAARRAATGGGDPGVQRETTTDPAGGGQNIGFIEDGDWWSLEPGQPDRHRRDPVPGRLRRLPAGGSRSAPARPTARCVATADRARHRRLADLRRRHRAGDRPAARARCSSSPRTRPAATASLFNVNWMDFLGRGVTDNAPPKVTRGRDPGHRHRAGHRRLRRHGHRRRGRHPADVRLGLR